MSTAQSARAHATLSPSGASRWIACPGSVLMESHVPDQSGDAANEGTAAHELAAWCLSDASRQPGDMLGRVIDITGTDHFTRFLEDGSPHKGDTNRWPVTEEMVEAVGEFVEYVRGLGGELSIEQRLDITHVHPDIWGTGDALVLAGDTLHVIDLKYGRGVVVEAENNSQLALYGSGAMQRYHNRVVKHVQMTIVQPRAPHDDGSIRSWAPSGADFHAKVTSLAEAARDVDAARTNLSAMKHDEWLAAYVTAGDHCRFCKVGGTCPVRAEQAQRDAAAEFGPVDDPMAALVKLSPEKIGDLLTKARGVQHWIKAVEEHANAEALAGRMPTGFKLVAKRATRKWTDEEAVIAAAPVLTDLTSGDLFEQKLLSPAQLEKKLPKADRERLAAFVTKASSGVNLVPEDDARPAIRPDATAEFSAIET